MTGQVNTHMRKPGRPMIILGDFIQVQDRLMTIVPNAIATTAIIGLLCSLSMRVYYLPIYNTIAVECPQAG